MKRARGSVQQLAKGRWRVRADVRGVHGSRNVRGSRKDAEKALDALIAELEAESGKVSCPTVSGFWRDFTRRCEVKGLRPSTMSGYQKVFRNHIEPAFGDMRLADVSSGDVSRLLMSLSAGSAKHVKSVLSAMFSHAEELGYVEVSVMRRRYTMPAARKRERNSEVWGWDKMMEVAALAEGEPFEAVYLLMAFAGLRREEACGVQPQDLERVRGWLTVRVSRTVQRVDSQTVVGPPKTPQSARVAVVCDDGAAERLEALASGTWLCGEAARNPDAASFMWRDFCLKHALGYIPLSNLRASFSTAMSARHDSAMVSKLTGHSSMDVQYRHYLRPGTDDFIDMLEG